MYVLMLLKFLQYSQENICAGVSFYQRISLFQPSPKRDFNTGDFCPVKIVEFLQTPFFMKHLQWLECFCQFDKELFNDGHLPIFCVLNHKHNMWDSFY